MISPNIFRCSIVAVRFQAVDHVRVHKAMNVCQDPVTWLLALDSLVEASPSATTSVSQVLLAS